MTKESLLYCHCEHMSTVKEERLQIRVDPANKALLERAAAASHLSVSAFVMQAAAAKAEEILAERSSIRLSPQATPAFSRPSSAPQRSTTAWPKRSGANASSAGLTELRRPAPLDPRQHDREQFDSGEPVLDEWLRRHAGQNRRRDTAATWVIVDARNVVVACASVAMTGIDRSATPEPLARRAPDPVPALLLGRLAVDRRYANLGIGTSLAAHVLATAAELKRKAACRAVVVTALNSRARTWRERLGFHPFDPDDREQPDLYLLTSEIQATLRLVR